MDRGGTLGSSKPALRPHPAPFRSTTLGNSLPQIRVLNYKIRLPEAQLHMQTIWHRVGAVKVIINANEYTLCAMRVNKGNDSNLTI